MIVIIIIIIMKLCTVFGLFECKYLRSKRRTEMKGTKCKLEKYKNVFSTPDLDLILEVLLS
jgi:hypothetical protein